MPKNDIFRYVAPFIVFAVLSSLQGQFNQTPLIWWAYGVKVLLTGALICILFRGRSHELGGEPGLFSVAVGLFVLLVWLANHAQMSQYRAAPPVFDPSLLGSTTIAAIAVAVRITGATLVVPVLEEIVWRSFLMRFLIDEAFMRVPMGSYSKFSFWFTALSFMFMHSALEWPAAAVAGLAYGGYMIRTKSLRGCIVAHAVTNLGLSCYVVLTGEWSLWG